MIDGLRPRTRLTLHELKMDDLDRIVPLLHRENNRQIRAPVKRLNLISIGHERLAKTPITFQRGDQLRTGETQREAKKGGEGQINKILIDLPTLRQSVTQRQTNVPYQPDEQELAYFSARLSYSRPKADKNLSSRYYRQIEVMKQIKVPIISQKIITINQIHTEQFTPHKEPLRAGLVQRERSVKKDILPISAAEKYHTIQQKEEIFIPRELYAKRIGSRYTIESLGQQTKNTIRFRYDPKRHNEKRSYKAIAEHYQQKIQGWQNDNYMMLQQLNV